MPGIPENLLFSFIDLVRQTLLLGIPVLFLAWTGRYVFRRMTKTQNWLVSALLATYTIVFALIIIAYFGPYLLGASDFAQGPVPQALAPTTMDLLFTYIGAILRVALISVALTLLLLPLEFAATAISDVLKPHLAHAGARFILTTLATILLALFLVLFLLP
ncbi:MAG: hypothetical protein Q7R47_05820, partial [Candidatus Diapherotrites archaeon]|nr:hypothetical protein [Candidatus Diapherotrites archaeon]